MSASLPALRTCTLLAASLLLALPAGLYLPTARADEPASLQILQQCLAATAASAKAAPTARNAGPPGASAPRVRSPPDSRSQLDAQLAARCPEAARALADLGLSTQIQSANGRLDRNALEDLVRVEQRYGAPMPSLAPGVATLPLALSRLQSSAAPHRSWWQALKERIEQWLGEPGAAGADWLQQLLQQLSIPQWVLRLILYLTTAAVLLTAVWIIGRELQAAGLLRSRAERRPMPIAGSTGVRGAGLCAAQGPDGIADLEQAPLAERSILLLRLLVQALLQSDRLSFERALTYRELGERGDFDDAQQRERFARLARLAERDRYGGGALQSHEWPAVAREGHTLYSQLRAPRTSLGGAAAATTSATAVPAASLEP